MTVSARCFKLFCLILFFCLFLSACGDKQKISDFSPEIIADIGGKYHIYDYEYRFFYKLTGDTEAALEEARRFKAAYILASENGYSLTDEEKSEILEAVISYKELCSQTYNISGSDTEDIIVFLHGITSDEYILYKNTESVVKKYKNDRILSFNDVKESELKEFYIRNEEEFKKIYLRFAFFSVEDGDFEAKEEYVRTLTLSISSDADMSAVVARESEDPGAADDGGLICIEYGKENVKAVFTAFASENDLSEGSLEIASDDSGVYLIFCVQIADFDKSEDIRSAVLNSYCDTAVENELSTAAADGRFALNDLKLKDK